MVIFPFGHNKHASGVDAPEVSENVFGPHKLQTVAVDALKLALHFPLPH